MRYRAKTLVNCARFQGNWKNNASRRFQNMITGNKIFFSSFVSKLSGETKFSAFFFAQIFLIILENKFSILFLLLTSQSHETVVCCATVIVWIFLIHEHEYNEEFNVLNVLAVALTRQFLISYQSAKFSRNFVFHRSWRQQLQSVWQQQQFHDN